MNKIFCIGSNKTGTTTLTQILKNLGFSVCPEDIMFRHGSKHFENQKQKQYDSLFELVGQYDAFEDRPWNHTNFYQILDKKFPNSKFILTIRDQENWTQSYRRFNEKIKLNKQWFYPLISEICYGNFDFLSDEKKMILKYDERNQEIIEYFKNTNKLLIIDFEKEKTYNRICEFLGKEIINSEIPHLNRTK
jgi:hypothetical protein